MLHWIGSRVRVNAMRQQLEEGRFGMGSFGRKIREVSPSVDLTRKLPRAGEGRPQQNSWKDL
jgi:hypothetical protein